MKTQIEQLIDRLADKSLTFGQRVILDKGSEAIYLNDQEVISLGEATPYNRLNDPFSKILGHPILIGDVLEKMKEKEVWFYDIDEAPILELWKDIGFTKSLQEILASTEWIWVCEECGKDVSEEVHAQTVHGCTRFFLAACPRVPKDKATRDLFEFLLQLDNNNEDE